MIILILFVLALVFAGLATAGIPSNTPRFNFLAASLFFFELATAMQQHIFSK